MPTKSGDMTSAEREVKCAEELCKLANQRFALQQQLTEAKAKNERYAANLRAAIGALTEENEQLQAHNAMLEDALQAMADDGWLYHGAEGMSEPQQKVYAAINATAESTQQWLDGVKAQARAAALGKYAPPCGWKMLHRLFTQSAATLVKSVQGYPDPEYTATQKREQYETMLASAQHVIDYGDSALKAILRTSLENGVSVFVDQKKHDLMGVRHD